jgi:ABC-type Na+ efflux pump permease subunit
MIGLRKLGPVFTYDMLALSRRWQVYASRAGFVLLLLIGMAIAWVSNNWSYGGYPASPTIADLAEMGEGFFYALASVQVSFILLAAPAAAAGSICIDRARGTLLHMMVTDLSDAEIVLGRLAARLAPIFGLVACGLPVVALAGLLGGIDFLALVGLFVISLAVGVLGCSLALAISVKASKTHEVLMAVYLIFGVWLLALPIWWILTQGGSKIPNPPQWFENLNPYALVFAPYTSPTTFSLADLAIFCGSVLTVAAALVVWSILNLRRAVIATSGEPKKRKPRFGWIKKFWPSMPGPTLDGNPVLWREWHRNRPSRMARWLWRGLYVVTWTLAFWGVIAILIGFNGIVNDVAFDIALMIQLFFGFLMVAATSPTVLAEERTRGSLDILLSTPLTTRSIVFAKWWGAYRMIFGLTILPAFAVIFLAATAPDVPSYAGSLGANYNPVRLTLTDRLIAPVISVADFLVSGALIVSIGVLLAT